MKNLNQDEINFIKFKNRLKTVPRTGWIELGIPREEVESVYAHIASTKDLISSFNDTYNLGLDINKINKMITIKELTKAFSEEEKSVIQGPNKKDNREIILSIKEMFNLDEDFINLYDEYASQQSNEARYALLFTKFESDLQAVDYYDRGLLKLDAVLKDVEYYPENIKSAAKEILEKYPIAPLAWLTFDSQYYQENELFTELSNNLICYCINKYKNQIDDQKKL